MRCTEGSPGGTFSGVRILVTGAARAIGRATAIECARRGHEVVATARDDAGFEAAMRKTLDLTW